MISKKFTGGLLFKTFLRLSLIMILIVTLIHGMIYYMSLNLYTERENIRTDEILQYAENILKNVDKESALKAINQISLSSDSAIAIRYDDDEHFFSSRFHKFYHFFNESRIDLPGDPEYDSLNVRTIDFEVAGHKIKLQVVKSITQIKDSKKLALSFIPFSLLMALIISVIASYFYAKSITDPIVKIEDTLNLMKTLKKDVRVEIKQNDEIGDLSRNINSLYVNLLHSIKEYETKNRQILKMESERTEFLKKSSHELKTPIAKLSILLENMILGVGKYRDKDKYIKEAYSIAEETSQMIKDLVKNSRTNSFMNRPYEEINISEILDETLDYYDLILEDKDIYIKRELNDFIVKSDRSEMATLFSNIISNIARYSKRNSDVSIKSFNRSIILKSIPEENIQETYLRIREKLEITDNPQYVDSVSSSGLGLGIIKKISEKYGISVNWEKDSEKLELILDFPYDSDFQFQVQ